MDLLQKIRKYENLHIVFWLIKDSCWMLELKWLGAVMMVPTLFLALYLVMKTFNSIDVYISLAIFFWILANSYWMMMEFFNDDHYKSLAAIPFGLGFIMVGVFYLKTYRAKRLAAQEQG